MVADYISAGLCALESRITTGLSAVINLTNNYLKLQSICKTKKGEL